MDDDYMVSLVNYKPTTNISTCTFDSGLPTRLLERYSTCLHQYICERLSMNYATSDTIVLRVYRSVSEAS
uniref:Uncharacterized protein n=1 Tax=Heterorhabditis bacteriophora TaxID=37862 RepID=A0A1I7X8N4_HETBA